MKHRSLKKRLVALATTVLTLVMCMAGTMSASAANTPATGGTTTFNKYLVMDANANVPNVTFDFSIAPGEAVAASGSNPAIYAGNDSHVSGTPTVGDAAFTTSHSTTNGLPTDQDDVTAGKKYAAQEVTVDFSSVTFSAPGIYRYIITESATSQDGIYNDASNTRTLDVFVEYADAVNGGRLQISKYALQDGDSTDPKATKSTGFTNTYTTNNLTLEKQVTGNQGNRDKYFEFTVTISGAVEGTVYTVDLSDAEEKPTVDGAVKTNETTLTATGGTVTKTYYLKDDQSIVIQGLTANTSYTITETNYSTDGYTTSYVLDGGDSTDSNTTDAQTMRAASHTITFTNTKNGIVPTGILLETAPYVILGAVVLAGFVVLFATRRRRNH